MAEKHLLKLAAKIERKLWAEYQDYLDECKSWYKQGYRPRHCEHGTNMWTDYDNICGGCEEGFTMSDGVQRRREALDRAHYIHGSTREAVDAMYTLSRLNLLDTSSEPAALMFKQINSWWEV